MSDKKVNSKMLKDLIKEVLEEKINLKWGGTASDKDPDLGIKKNKPPGTKDLNALAGLDKKPGDLTDDDLKAATGATKVTADTWYANTTSTAVDRNTYADLDAYLASLGGSSGSTFFFKDSTQTDLKPTLHLKNKPSQGNKNAIAKELKAYINASPTPTNADVQAMIDEITKIFGTDIGTGNLDKAVNSARALLRGAPPANPISNALKTKLVDIATSLETAQTQDITAPMIQDVGSAGSATSTGGKFPPGLITPLNDMFSGEDTYEKRLQKLSDVSDLLINGNATTITAAYKGKEREFLRDIIIMDYFATIFREVDDRAIAYYFEALGALIGGGKVAGAGGVSGDFTVAVSTGQQDFEGSSKFFQKGSPSNQALSGFEPGVEVLYLVAKKSVSKSKERTVLPIMAYTVRMDSAPPYDGSNHVNNLQISTSPAGLYTGEFVANAKGNSSSITAKSNRYQHTTRQAAHGTDSYGNGDFYYSLQFGPNIVGTEFKLHFAKGKKPIKNLKSLLDSVTKKSSFDSKLKKAYGFMKTYFEKMKLSQSSIKDYIGSDDVQKGSDALDALTDADKNLQSLITSYGGRAISNKRSAQALKKRVVSENKITSDFLKKLFKETLNK